MGLYITFYLEGKQAHVTFSYGTIHILRMYACNMVGAKDEDDSLAIENFPNLVWHSDCEGYYVGFLPEEWDKKSQLWIGSVEGLYQELQKISVHMIANNFDGEAKEVLKRLLGLFNEVDFDEENCGEAYIVFS